MAHLTITRDHIINQCLMDRIGKEENTVTALLYQQFNIRISKWVNCTLGYFGVSTVYVAPGLVEMNQALKISKKNISWSVRSVCLLGNKFNSSNNRWDCGCWWVSKIVKTPEPEHRDYNRKHFTCLFICQSWTTEVRGLSSTRGLISDWCMSEVLIQQQQLCNTLWMVCLWLSLFFSSSFRACTPAMRRSSSWKRKLQSERRSISRVHEKERWPTKEAVRRADHRGGWESLLHHRIICVIPSLQSTSPAVEGSWNSQNAMLPTESDCASWERERRGERGGGDSAVCG